MEAYYAFVGKIVKAFEASGLKYAFTGALAISFYGVPRTTSDIDVIVAVTDESNLKGKLATALQKAGMHFEEHKIDSALTSGFRIASFKDKTSPYSIDIIFSDSELKRKAGKIAGCDTFFQSPEELIAAKLRMIKVTLPPERAAKDRKDIEAILKFTPVDLKAVRKRAKEDNTLNVFDSLGLKA
ncbi:MAG: nucleotidyl transferase AbiEii/AbiGii toxin family protein [Candidatus Bathyarchaeota archaeon]|nr:nucleotidyl transferase AbiEii/AbiGii toxin family protein [Candidatus Bathyarchaeota archaeon]